MYKILLLGPKSTSNEPLVQRLAGVPYEYKPDIGATIYRTSLLDRSTRSNVEIWDINDHEKYEAFSQVFYSDVSIIIATIPSVITASDKSDIESHFSKLKSFLYNAKNTKRLVGVIWLMYSINEYAVKNFGDFENIFLEKCRGCNIPTYRVSISEDLSKELSKFKAMVSSVLQRPRL